MAYALDLTGNLNFTGDAVAGTATKNTTTNFDYKVTATKIYLNGGDLIFKNANWGDYVQLQIIDIDNVLGQGANYVLHNYVNKWYIHPDLKEKELTANYAGNIPQNIYIRLKYISTSTTTDVNVAVNWYLHSL
jgi:hypothetical protein